MTRITVIPGAGRSVPDPQAGDLLPAEGRTVDDSPYWRRRLDDGDVTLKPKTKAKDKAASEVAE